MSYTQQKALDSTTRAAVVDALRSGADELIATDGLVGPEHEQFYPNWDIPSATPWSTIEHHAHQMRSRLLIQLAARAVLAETNAAGEGGQHVPLASVGMLVHYIADMLEE